MIIGQRRCITRAGDVPIAAKKKKASAVAGEAFFVVSWAKVGAEAREVN
jgi:hypothetical protein